ncbi:MAG: C39 family peptidase [Chloroflexi bacterium]|nr:C39 family peptidase [Chloroflexota bacterium]
MRSLAVALLLSVACRAPAAAPSPSPTAAAVTERPAPTPPAAATSVPTPSAPPASPPPTAKPLAGARIELFEVPLAPAQLSGTAIGEGGGVILISGTSGTWISGWHEPGFTFTRLVPSWNADTPDGTWIEIEVQTRRSSGGETKWWSFGSWAYGDGTIKRASVRGQRDADGDVDIDVLLANAPMSAYRARLTLARVAGSAQAPVVRLVTAVASDPATATTSVPSPVGPGAGKELPVPPYSQEIHAGEYPEYDGGGEAWCSPTSTAMVLSYWGKGPSPADLAWVAARHQDPQVDHAARYTYDATYRGAGNWPFNTAYAARNGLRAFVTQLRSLNEAERFIAAGIPLVASVRIAPGALPGFLLPQGSPGHLLVISGFTASGDVISHDPAANSNADVRRVYPRARFEQVWLGGSHGTVYVIHPPTTPLPPRIPDSTPNW